MSNRILVIEDDSDIRNALSEILRGEGYEVDIAINGQDGIDRLNLSRELPDLILLDLMMPVKDGFQFRDEQLANSRLKDIPVIVMSADGHVKEKRAEAGVEDFLKKPLDIDVLLSVVARNIH